VTRRRCQRRTVPGVRPAGALATFPAGAGSARPSPPGQPSPAARRARWGVAWPPGRRSGQGPRPVRKSIASLTKRNVLSEPEPGAGPTRATRSRPAAPRLVRSRVSPARPGGGPGPDPVAASCGLWSIEFPWVDQFDPGSGEVIGVASRQRRFGSAADGRDLGVGHADRPPERFPAADDIGVP
jgi:hypothetical protein